MRTSSFLGRRWLLALVALAGCVSGLHTRSAFAQDTELLSNGNFAGGLSNWRSDAKAPDPSGSLAQGQSIPVGSNLIQNIDGDRLVAGQGYVLRVTLDAASGAGAGTAAVVFRIPAWNQSFRTFTAPFDASKNPAVELSFVAPEFTRMAEVRLSSLGGQAVRVKAVSLMKRPRINLVETVDNPQESHVPAGYTMVFNDEFNGTALDKSKWFTRYIYENETLDHLKDEQQRYRENGNHVVAGGRLTLIARPVGNNLYESGMIRSDWTARYGYFEARVKMPGARGVFPAFWLNSDVASDGTQNWPPEIDIFEYVNNGAEDTPDMLHSSVIQQTNTAADFVYTDPTFNTQWSYWRAPYAFDQGWHTIGAEWTENSVSTFVDGKKIMERNYRWQYSDGRPAPKAYVMLNLAIGGEWAGRHGIDDANFPTTFEIDWVRAYQRSDGSQARSQ
ncbi:MAG: hypothetical protein JWQ73_642 [Variovorax sp.]|nr:hypothetical protein [Variovorax sp.]